MHVVVLTGGLGAGKSTAAAWFAERGATVLDLDEVAKALLGPGSALLDRVAAEFGPSVRAADGSLDRAVLAEAAFATPEATARLDAIVHPAVAAEVGSALAELRLQPHQPEVVVLEVPLLAEAPVFAELADAVLAIEAPAESRVERAGARGMDAADARARIAAQASDTERAELADAVIVNDGSAEAFRSALEGFWAEHVAGPDRR